MKLVSKINPAFRNQLNSMNIFVIVFSMMMKIVMTGDDREAF